ncbi:MAG: aldehyde dehydrogenase family protein [Clostridiales Family XIII bacterium]|jgi:succinate-semialdehyde dehydrogenase|nr:aldehyde dehydrogenase family protein [Clostridiales Family XIII bacterium]
MDAKEHVSELIGRARAAQKIFETYPQERVDEAVRAIGKAVYDNAELLARMAVDETGMGNYEDKILKNKGKPKVTWQKLKGVKSRGVIRRIEEQGLAEVAKPMGVIGAVTPVTNPVMTPVHNAMIALKGGNAIILCSHPKGDKTGKKTVEIMREALKKIDAPEDLIQVVAESTVETSSALMATADACVSTGGPGMVKAAYSSGKPAFGVGPGNVQCLVDRDANIPDAVAKIVRGRTYDNGVLCTCEQAAHIPKEKAEEIIAEFEKQGAYFVGDPAEADKFRKTLFIDGVIAKSLVGAKPVTIAKAAGVDIAEDTKLIVVKIDKTGAAEPLSREKLFPVLALYVYDSWEDGVANAAENIDNEGTGHSAVIHSYTRENIEYAANRIRVSRFSVNQIGSNSLGGTLTNGLNPTATLGCGTWGNNSLSENLWFHHLINISRIAYEIADAPAAKLSDEEIWG